MPLAHYTVRYHDTEQHRHEICEYATDSYEAIKDAQEDVPFLREHPSFVDSCTNETGLDYLMGIVPMGR
tara:strand:+ start:1269 stop:1475 length:207 start_codon:yes stop_codon:yes gene_type:complete